MFACRDAVELMTEADEGTLRGWKRVFYRFHTFICPYCSACRHQLDEARTLAREIPPDPVPPGIEDRALAALRDRARNG